MHNLNGHMSMLKQCSFNVRSMVNKIDEFCGTITTNMPDIAVIIENLG
jgi:hypothetical protein